MGGWGGGGGLEPKWKNFWVQSSFQALCTTLTWNPVNMQEAFFTVQLQSVRNVCTAVAGLQMHGQWHSNIKAACNMHEHVWRAWNWLQEMRKHLCLSARRPPPAVHESVNVHMWECVCACGHHFVCGRAHGTVRSVTVGAKSAYRCDDH